MLNILLRPIPIHRSYHVCKTNRSDYLVCLGLLVYLRSCWRCHQRVPSPKRLLGKIIQKLVSKGVLPNLPIFPPGHEFVIAKANNISSIWMDNCLVSQN